VTFNVIANDQHTKFELPSCSNSKDDWGKFLNGSRDPDHAHWWAVLSTQGFHFSRSGDMIAGVKTEKGRFVMLMLWLMGNRWSRALFTWQKKIKFCLALQLSLNPLFGWSSASSRIITQIFKRQIWLLCMMPGLEMEHGVPYSVYNHRRLSTVSAGNTCKMLCYT